MNRTYVLPFDNDNKPVELRFSWLDLVLTVACALLAVLIVYNGIAALFDMGIL